MLELDPNLESSLHALLGVALADALGVQALRPIPA